MVGSWHQVGQARAGRAAGAGLVRRAGEAVRTSGGTRFRADCGGDWPTDSTAKQLVKDGFFHDALNVYHFLRASNADRTYLPFVYFLKACGELSAIHEGQAIHSLITKAGLDQNLTFQNSLIEMYSNFAHVTAARQVFDAMPQRNIVSWNLMMLGYGVCDQPISALEFCTSMKNNGVALDSVGFKIVLPICGQANALEIGESVHGHLVVSGASNNTVLATAIMDMYAKCGELVAAEKAFMEIEFKDVVSWNAMIGGYAQARKYKLLLELLYQMHLQGFKPSVPTILLSVQACTHLPALQLGKSIHGQITRNGLSVDISIKGLLIGMYSKCGELLSSYNVFSEIIKVNVCSWSCMINGLGIHGYIKESLMLFFAMIKHGGKPDDICFLILLSSCSHWGLINEGLKVFYYMISMFGIEPRMEHWASLVDLIGRAGCINEAFRFMNEMPLEPNSSLIGAFLGSCRIHREEKMWKELGDCLIERGCVVPGFYKLLVGIRAGEEQWNEVNRVRNVIKKRRLWGNSGTSLVDISSS
ncbi:pentatricopeptide repeat-containing protein DOT4, chloroplastic [Dendrobium catenatum]|uniref:pentatricopeptide repeat-containing protein DOT4, chloroplastic n=1 Tax=Dendrobium catenatum TaxID=906689 RepID=UPI0009F65B2E|nr:pentatricopeptide repeat-containing protein DOT4, chloroplastic [Dendrobium catenatum]